MQARRFLCAAAAAAAAAAAIAAGPARADAVTDWNTRANELVVEAKMGTPPAVRLMALLQTAVHDAVQAATTRHGTAAAPAAVAAANRVVLARLLPAQEAAVTAAYQAAVAALPEGHARTGGIEAGEQAAAALLAARLDDGAGAPERYRPVAAAGNYVPTLVPAVPQWGQRKPWLLARADQFRPPAPTPLTSAEWARDYAEVKLLGSRTSTVRTQAQTDIARFWEFSLPAIYFDVVRSVATAGSRDLLRNARLYAASAQAMDDGMIAVLEAKYHYGFWRPITAIRNGDQDGNDHTERDAAWHSLVNSPLHPEYPSAHATLAGSVAAVLKAEVGGNPLPVLATSSPTLKGRVHRWTSADSFVQEVGESRIYAGIHYRQSTDAGALLGRRIGELAAERLLRGAGH